MNETIARMAEAISRILFTGEQVLDLLDSDVEDGEMDEVFFPGSDDELGFAEEEIEDRRRLVKVISAQASALPYLMLM